VKCDDDDDGYDDDLRSKFALQLLLLLDAPNPRTVVSNVFSKQLPTADCLGMGLANKSSLCVTKCVTFF
jgi:hypothetical protein